MDFKTYLLLILYIGNSYGQDEIPEISFNSSFNDYEDNITPLTWTLNITSLNISFVSTNFTPARGDTWVIDISVNDDSLLTDTISLDMYLNCTSSNPFQMHVVCWIAFDQLMGTARLPTLDEKYDNSILSIKKLTEEWGKTKIILKECSQQPTNGTSAQILTSNSSDATNFNAPGKCSCLNKDAELYYKNGSLFGGMAHCNAVSRWEGCENAECWYAPSNVTVDQGSKCSGDPVNFSCNYEDGYPIPTELFYINDVPISNNADRKLQPTDHNESYHCAVWNNFTTIEDPKLSNFGTLIVYFSPNITKSTESPKTVELNSSTCVYFVFKANPAPGSITTTFSSPNGSLKRETFKKHSSDVNYNVTYTITINSSMDYGLYNFTVQTAEPKNCDTALIDIVNQTETVATTAFPITTDMTPNQDTLYIAIGCSVAVVLIIVLVVFLIVYRRRKGKSASDEDIKEERENPLYGSAPGPSANAEYATVDKSKKKHEKEEKVNPIYQGTSAGADADTVEEAYAAIDIKKKKKKKEKNSEGSENSAFDPEATYAAVNKPKKKKNAEPPPDVVYSAVQKKKKNDQPADTDLHV